MSGKLLTVTDCFKESDLPEDDEVARLEYGGYQRAVRSQRSTGANNFETKMGKIQVMVVENEDEKFRNMKERLSLGKQRS